MVLDRSSPHAEHLSELDPRVRRTRADVVVAAGQILLEEGWEAVTHANVARRAGYSRATLYRHWRDQQDLIEMALEHISGVVHSAPTGDVEQDLVAELEALRQFLLHRGFGPVLAALNHHALADDRIRVLRDDTLDRGLGPLRRILREAERQGRLHPALDVPSATALLTGGLFWEAISPRSNPGRAFVERSAAVVLGP